MTRTLVPTFKRDRVSRARPDQTLVTDSGKAIGDSATPRAAAASRAATKAQRATSTSGSHKITSTSTSDSTRRGLNKANAPPPSERWVTRFKAFKCVHLDPMAEERAAAQLETQARAQVDAAAQVDSLMSQAAGGGTLRVESFIPRPSRTTRKVENVAAFLASVADKKLIRRARANLSKNRRRSAVSIDEDAELMGSRKFKRNAKPLVSRRDARAPSPSPPNSGDEAEERRTTREEKQASKTSVQPLNHKNPNVTGYASKVVPSPEELGDVMQRVRALRAGGDSDLKNFAEKNEELESQRGALEAYHGSLKATS